MLLNFISIKLEKVAVFLTSDIFFSVTALVLEDGGDEEQAIAKAYRCAPQWEVSKTLISPVKTGRP